MLRPLCVAVSILAASPAWAVVKPLDRIVPATSEDLPEVVGPITISAGMPVVNVMAFGHDWTDFPGSETSATSVFLVSFPKDSTTNVVFQWLRVHNMRPATASEVSRFSDVMSHIAPGPPIVVLGSWALDERALQYSDDLRCAILYHYDEGVSDYIEQTVPMFAHSPWAAHVRFLAVPLDESQPSSVPQSPPATLTSKPPGK